jgi:hypothetical protein
MELESKAADLGIPMKMMVNDDLRYSYCSAFEATLASIEGQTAIYQGVCANGHHYKMDFEIAELQRKASIMNGEIVFGGDDKGYKAQDLEEY